MKACKDAEQALSAAKAKVAAADALKKQTGCAEDDADSAGSAGGGAARGGDPVSLSAFAEEGDSVSPGFVDGRWRSLGSFVEAAHRRSEAAPVEPGDEAAPLGVVASEFGESTAFLDADDAAARSPSEELDNLAALDGAKAVESKAPAAAEVRQALEVLKRLTASKGKPKLLPAATPRSPEPADALEEEEQLGDPRAVEDGGPDSALEVVEADFRKSLPRAPMFHSPPAPQGHNRHRVFPPGEEVS
jgi:hypothetical protein